MNYFHFRDEGVTFRCRGCEAPFVFIVNLLRTQKGTRNTSEKGRFNRTRLRRFRLRVPVQWSLHGLRPRSTATLGTHKFL